MKNSKLVSICIPTYNGEKYLQEALDSVSAQTYRPIECIISDDDSSDDTLGIVSRFRESVDFPVHVHHHKPQGIGANWNHCVEKANGEYIKFLFQDDLLHPLCIERFVQVFEKRPDIGLVACKRKFIIDADSEGETIKKWIATYGDLQSQYEPNKNGNYKFTNACFKDSNFFKSPLNKIGEPSLVLFKKSLYQEIGPFRLDLKQILDYEYWNRILLRYPIIVLGEELASFRIHSMQATNVNRKHGTNDYALYNQILYDEYLPLLNKAHQIKLKNTFHPYYRIKNKVFKKIKKWIKG